jgi:hypothetical protein
MKPERSTSRTSSRTGSAASIVTGAFDLAFSVDEVLSGAGNTKQKLTSHLNRVRRSN